MAQPAGPTTEAVWTRRTVSGFALLAQPSDTAAPGYAVAAQHRVARVPAGDPVVSLTLVLDGVPDPAEHDVTPRVRQGTLALRVGLDAPPSALAPTGLRPLYVREGTTGLFAGPATELVTGPVSGTWTDTSLSVTLDRDQTIAVIEALDGTGEGIDVVSTLWYRAVLPPGRVHLTGSWAEVYDVLAARPGAPDLPRLFADVVASGVVHADPADQADGALATFVSMARSVLLDRDGLVGPRPTPYFSLDITASSAGTGVDRYLTVSTPLKDVLGGCLNGRDRSKFISLLSFHPPVTGQPSTSVGVPRRVSSPRQSRDTAVIATPRFAQLSSGRLVSTATVLGAVRPAHGVLIGQLADSEHWELALPDHTDAGNGQPDLPLVSDATGWTFDGQFGAQGWYAPTFTVVMPRPDQDHQNSPFVFEFSRTGTTLAGLPGLHATVSCRLRAVAPDGADGLRPVPLGDVSVVLDLPFRDSQGHDQRQRLPGNTHWDGDELVVTVELIDDWARMAYGALSRPGFQSQPARIGVMWSFLGCEQVRMRPDWLVWGGKTAVLPVQYDGPHTGPRPEELYVDATTSTLRTPAGAYQFQTHTPERISGLTASVVVQPHLLTPTIRAVRSSFDAVRLRPNHFQDEAIEPEALSILPYRPTRILQRTFVRAQSVEVLFPCDELGACYVEQKPEGPVAIGCQDALRLGQADWRQYDEIPALADPRYKVYRSLQQPGRFVVLPKRFVVGRRPAGDPGAWQAAILLYSLLDSDDPAGNQVVVDCTLAPDVDPWMMASLRAALRRYAADPVIDLATDVECMPTFTWTVVGLDSVHVAASLVDGGMRVSIQSDLAHALLLRDMLEHAGLSGTVALALPDGTEMRASLQIDLRAQAGPQPKGPLEITVTGTQLTAINRIERQVDLTAMRIDSGASTLNEIAVEISLAPGASTPINLAAAVPLGSSLDREHCWPVYSVPDVELAALPEIRSYVEDIRMNVVFLDLIDHASRSIVQLDILAKLQGVGAPEPVAMVGNPAVGSAIFVLPLTAFLGSRTVEYQVTVSRDGQLPATTGWLTHDAAVGGSLINLTWDSLGLA